MLESPSSVAKNRGVVFGTVPINFGAYFSGVAGNYLLYQVGGLLNKPAVVYVIEFVPYFTPFNGMTTAIFSGDLIRPYIDPTGVFYVYIDVGPTWLFAVPLATYLPYWNANKRNVLVINMFDANSNLILNGTQIGASVGGVALQNPATISFGAAIGGGTPFTGRFLSVKIFTGNTIASFLTLSEARDYYNS